MTRILPSVSIMVFGGLFACATEKVVAPGPPIPAPSEVHLDTMENECNAFIAALEKWRACPNLEQDEQETIDFWIERAKNDFAMGLAAKPDAGAQKSIAGRCHRASESVAAATERCGNGRRPKAW